MHFEFTHTFQAPFAVVQKAMLDDRYLPFLLQHHGKMEEAQVLESKVDGNVIKRRVRYRPRPIIESVGPKKIPPEYLAFVEESTFDLGAGRLDFKNVATVAGVAKHLSNRGSITFRDVGAQCERRTQGTLEIVELPFLLRPLGPIAERIIHVEAQKLLDAEARVLAQFLRENG